MLRVNLVDISKLVQVWAVSEVALEVPHVDLVAKLSLSIYVLFSIKINLFKVLVDLRLSVVDEIIHSVVGGNLLLISDLTSDKFVHS